MGLFGSSILVKYSLLNSSGSMVYAGNSSNSLRLWGAQLELAEYSEDILNDYINNYRYTRTTGIEHNFIGLRISSGANGDPNYDSILIGGGSGTRMNNVYQENVAFFVDKSPKRGLDTGTAAYTTSVSYVTTSLLVTNTVNWAVDGSEYAWGGGYNGLAYTTEPIFVSSTAQLSPTGSVQPIRLTESNATYYHEWYVFNRVAQEDEYLNYSIYVRPNGRNQVRLLWGYGNITDRAIAHFDLATGVTFIESTGSYDNVSSAMISVGNSWWRCSISARRTRPTSILNNYSIQMAISSSVGQIYTGDGYSGIYIWGTQVAPMTITNLSTNSTDVASPAWATAYNQQTTTSANSATAPDGTLTADAITFLGSGYRYNQFQATSAITGRTYTFSAWIWTLTGKTTGGLRIANATDGTDQTVTSVTLTTTPTRYSVTRTFTGGSAPTERNIIFGFDNRATLGGDDTTGTMIAWGTQLEIGPFASTHVKTTSAPAMVSSYVATLGWPLYVSTTSGPVSLAVSSTMNLLSYSEDFSQTGTWVNVNGTILRTAVPGAAPDGSTAYLLTKYIPTNADEGTEQILNITSGTTLTSYFISLYVKPYDLTTDKFDLHTFFTGTAVKGSQFRYNFQTDTITANAAEGPGVVPWGYGRQKLDNGWIRIWFRVQDADPGAANSYLQYRIYPAGRNTGTGRMYVWGAQVLKTATSDLSNSNAKVDPYNLIYLRTTSAPILYQASTGLTYTYQVSSSSVSISTSYTLSATVSGNAISGASPDAVFVGQQYRPDTRLSGDPLERLTFDVKNVLRDTPTVSDDRRRIPSNPVIDAAKVMGLELVKKTTDTFSYNRYTPVSGDNVYYNAYDWFSDVGRSQRAKMAIGNDTQVNFFDKHLDETKQIPQNPRFDALRVMGIEPVNKTSSIINLAKYTPVRSTDYTYYKKYDWYSMVPRSQYAKFALGIGDGSPYIFDNMMISADKFEFTEDKHFYDSFLIGFGSTSQTSRLAGRDDPETMRFDIKKVPKRGVGSTIVINNRHEAPTDATLVTEYLYNYVSPKNALNVQPLTDDDGNPVLDESGNSLTYVPIPYLNKWYQLAPYYSAYSHIVDGVGDNDLVRVGSLQEGPYYSGSKYETFAMFLMPKPVAEYTITTDSTSKYAIKTAKKAVFSSNTLVSVIRTNIITNSERMDRSSWSTTGATVTTSATILSPQLLYRNVSYDADQMYELFHNKANTYLPKAWYNIVPLATRTAFTSNGISVVNVTSSNSQHGVSTTLNYTEIDNHFIQGMYVKNKQGVNKVRLVAESSESHYADFDLSSVSVITSVNLTHAAIVPQGNGWYLIKIMGPTSGAASLGYLDLSGQIFNDRVTVTDNYELVSNLFEEFIPTDMLL